VFGEHAADAHSGAMPRLLSLWVPLTEVTCDNGCMFVVPREADELLHQPHHPRHLTPFDQHSRRCPFDMSTAVARAPVAAGTALAWLGSSIHWGGVCSRYADAEPRASLTAAVRLRDAAHTQLQGQQEGSLPEVTLEALPLPLHERVRYACGSVLLYAWWYGLGRGVILPDEALEPQELEAR
jgi:ectoine hydroxylase-related dioxygenase (phytanoyl-CoA dioxygenase family)